MKVIGQLERAQVENATPSTLPGAASTGRLYADVTSPTAAVLKYFNGTNWVTIQTTNSAGILAPTVATFTSTGASTYNLPYVFVTTSCNATVGATYTVGAVTYTVYATVSGSTRVIMRGPSAPPTSGTLTKASGTGDATITYLGYATPLFLKVKMVGGGGGGAGSGQSAGTAPGSGGNTTFGTSFLVANGGGPGTNSGGTSSTGGTVSVGSGAQTIFALAGAPGQGGGVSGNTTNGGFMVGGMGGSSPFSGAGSGGGYSNPGNAAVANSGSGGGGAGCGTPTTNFTFAGGGGAAGGYIECLVNSPSPTYPVSVGVGGTAGGATTDGYAGASGGSGQITIEEYYQ